MVLFKSTRYSLLSTVRVALASWLFPMHALDVSSMASETWAWIYWNVTVVVHERVIAPRFPCHRLWEYFVVFAVPQSPLYFGQTMKLRKGGPVIQQ